MSKTDFLVKIPREVCDDKSGKLDFDEAAWSSGDSNSAVLRVNKPINFCGTFKVVSETKRLKRVWLLDLKSNNHQNRSYPVTVINYQKSRM